MSLQPTHGMILSAGEGRRMRPLTLTQPKPLIAVAGTPLIGHALAALEGAGVTDVVINVHYLAAQLEDWAQAISHPRIVVSDERAQLLDTGGGVAKALPLLGQSAFYVMNGDGFWREDGEPALIRLAQAWRDDAMDCLLLLSPLAKTTGFDGAGDFVMDAEGRLARFKVSEGSGKPLAYIGGYIVHPRLFQTAPEIVAMKRFSMNMLWDHAMARGRLFGLEHLGHWLHVGTPEAIHAAEMRLAARA
jgi:N-acetyl-alpha-D-muramate 1-phosphate uridylyltransferase